jgi:uncharacterized SAM-binding protein YcdF (DUF218 family)
MFFVLSKTLNYLTTPLSLICLCLFASVFIRNKIWKRRLYISGLVLLLFFTNEFIANEFMSAWEVHPRPYNLLRKHTVGIVLTGATLIGIKPNDRVYFQRGADRVTHTIQLYKLGLIEKILISGGSGRLIDNEEREADQFKDVMVLMGVPEGDIIIENETRNTHESAVEVKRILSELNISSNDCLLITSAFHMRRSLACYRKVGLELEPFSTDIYSHPRVFYPDTLIFPKSDALGLWHKLSREWVGFIAYKLAGYV